MTIIITMAGLGTRFKQAGYACPKYMIEAKGKTLFAWSMESLLGYGKATQKYVFIVRREDHARDFIIGYCRENGLQDFEIVELDHLTDGQATTALLGIKQCAPEEPILIYNIDTYVEPYELKDVDLRGDGHIPCFHAPGDHWSFVKLDNMGNVIEVKEKERISDLCTLGAYYFSSAALYRQIYDEFYSDTHQMPVKEKYIAPMYNYMLQQGYTVTVSVIGENKVHVLGTPQELESFKSL